MRDSKREYPVWDKPAEPQTFQGILALLNIPFRSFDAVEDDGVEVSFAHSQRTRRKGRHHVVRKKQKKAAIEKDAAAKKRARNFQQGVRGREREEGREVTYDDYN